MAQQTSRPKRLKLSIEKTFKHIPIYPQPVRLKLGHSIHVIATISTDNIASCQIAIRHPQDYLQLQNQPSIITLTPALSPYESDIRWTLRASKLTSAPLWISIRAMIANKAIQQAGFAMEIINNEQL